MVWLLGFTFLVEGGSVREAEPPLILLGAFPLEPEDFGLEPFAGLFESFQLRFKGSTQTPTRLQFRSPFLRESVRELQHFLALERFFQNVHPIRSADLREHLLPRVIRVSGANDDLQIRIGDPQLRRHFDPVPAWRHPHVDEGDLVWVTFLDGVVDTGEALFALKGGIDLEVVLLAECRRFAEQRRFVGIESRSDAVDAKDFPKIGMDIGSVVDNENPVTFLLSRIIHVDLRTPLLRRKQMD